MKKQQSLIKNLAWDYMAKLTTQIFAFIVSIMLARILGPSDYGVVAAATIFSTICIQIVGGGFGSGLIQRSESNALDFSSMFFFNLCLGTVLFLIIFFCSPFIENFFGYQNLSIILRLLSIQIPFSAINAIGNAYLVKKLQFKKYSIAASVSSIIGGICAIISGFCGFGPFSLVIQYLGSSILTTVFLVAIIKKRPLFYFSFKRNKFYISFGWKILVTGLLDTLYNDFKSLVLGKVHTSGDLAYNNKGAMLPSSVVTNINQTLMNVLFPYLSKEKDDISKLSSLLSQSILCSTFVVFPSMIGLIVVSHSLILLLLGEAWISTIPFLCLYAIYFLGAPIYLMIEQGIKSLGKGTAILVIGLIKTAFGFLMICLCVFVFKEPIFIAVASVLSNIFNIVFLLMVSKKYLKLPYKKMFLELLNNLLISLLMGLTVYCFRSVSSNALLNIFIQVIVGVITYVAFAKLFNNRQFLFICESFKRILHPKKN